eukprot:13914-Heterococcus_DN1.PRE.1
MDSLACYPPYHQGAGKCIVRSFVGTPHGYLSMKAVYLLCFQCEIQLRLYCCFHCKCHSAALWRRGVSYRLHDRYILSSALVKYLYSGRQHLESFVNEDVTVGSWLMGVDRMHLNVYSLEPLSALYAAAEHTATVALELLGFTVAFIYSVLTHALR